MRIRVLNSDVYVLKGTDDRFFHLATLTRGLHEYMVFFDDRDKKVFVEKITGGHLEYVDDESLWEELATFAQNKGLTDIARTYIEKQKTK